MKSIHLLVLVSMLASAAEMMGRPLQDQEPQPQEQPQAGPQQGPVTGPQTSPAAGPYGQQNGSAAGNMELFRLMLDPLELDSLNAGGSQGRKISKRYVAPPMVHDSEFDLRSIPLEQWLNEKDAAQLPWTIDMGNSALRLDQRLEVAYTARIHAKHLNKLGSAPDLYFVIGVTGITGEWLVAPKVVHQLLKNKLPNNFELWFSEWVFAEPGNYVFWFVLYDRQTGKHNVARRRVEVAQIKNDPFPHAADGLPRVELPRPSGREPGTFLGSYSGLRFPVQNKQRLQVELVPVLSPPEQWVGQTPIMRSHKEKTAAAVNTLWQLGLADGSISITGLDVIRRLVPFEQKDLGPLDWKAFTAAIETDNITVSASTRWRIFPRFSPSAAG